MKFPSTILLLCLISPVCAQVESGKLRVMARASDYFRNGKAALEENKRRGAGREFDRAVGEVLLSGFDVRADPELSAFYSELIERIYREEIPPLDVGSTAAITIMPQAKPTPPIIGFKEQKIDSANDRLARPVAQPPKDAIVVQGFWLGMDLDDADLRSERPIDSDDDLKLGFKQFTFYRFELDRRNLNNASRSGVTKVDLSFLDDELVSLQAFYDNSVDFRNVTEFASAIGKALNLSAGRLTVSY